MLGAVREVLHAGEQLLAPIVLRIGARRERRHGHVASALAAGFAGANAVGGTAFADGFSRVMWMTAALCAAGGLISLVAIRGSIRLHVISHPGTSQACDDPGLILPRGKEHRQAT